MAAEGLRRPASTSVTKSVPAWTNEKVTVYAVNSVGGGPRSTASGTAWARSGTDRLRRRPERRPGRPENACPTPAAPGHGAQQRRPDQLPGSAGPRAGAFRLGPGQRVPLCGLTAPAPCPVIATPWSPAPRGCLPAALPGYQPPDTPHPIAYVSTNSIRRLQSARLRIQGPDKGQQRDLHRPTSCPRAARSPPA